MKSVDKEMQNVARRLHKNLYLMMGQNKPIKIKELSKISGVSITTISRIKNDWQGLETPKLETVIKLSVALGVDPVELLKEA